MLSSRYRISNCADCAQLPESRALHLLLLLPSLTQSNRTSSRFARRGETEGGTCRVIGKPQVDLHTISVNAGEEETETANFDILELRQTWSGVVCRQVVSFES